MDNGDDQLQDGGLVDTWLPRAAFVLLGLVSITTAWAIFAGGQDSSDALDTESAVLTQAGKTTNLEEFVGRPLVINFYASTCAPCRAELPDFDEAYSQVSDQVDFVGVNHDTTEAVWRSFDEEIPVTYDTVFQPEQTVFKSINGIGMPTTLFVNSEGTIVKKFTGPLEKENLLSLIESELGI